MFGKRIRNGIGRVFAVLALLGIVMMFPKRTRGRFSRSREIQDPVGGLTQLSAGEAAPLERSKTTSEPQVTKAATQPATKRTGARRGVTVASMFAMFSVVGILALLAVVVTDTGFEIDGNLDVGDDGGAWDWGVGDEAVGSAITGGGPAWDGGPGILIIDEHSKVTPDPDIFSPAGKFGEPENWTVSSGQNPGQNELTNVYVWAVAPGDVMPGGVGNTDTWLNVGMERTKKQGTFDLDFELNQVAWDGSSNSLIRTPGDVVAAFELKGNPSDPQADLEVVILVYQSPSDTCATVTGGGGKIVAVGIGTDACPAYEDTGFIYRFRGPAIGLGTFGFATMNADTIDKGAWGSLDPQGNERADIGEFQFAEAALNLTALGLDPGCPGFGSVHAKSRSSLEATADLKDLAGPAPLPVECFIEGTKYLDVNGNGQRDAGEPGLENWEIQLSGAGSATAFTDEFGYYKFDNLANGSYTVTEVCPTADPAWVQTEPGFDAADDCGDEVL